VLIVWAVPDALAGRTVAALERVLDDDERERAARFAHEPERRAFVTAHGVLRFALSRFAPRAPGSWRFARGPGGRPEVASAQAPAFSLTQTRGLIACAVALHGAVGIDAEEIAEAEPGEGLLALTCTADEIGEIRALPEDGRAAAFARSWTRKEAAVKALGTAGDFRPELPIEAEVSRALSWTTFNPTPRHVVSVALTGASDGPDGPTIYAVSDDWVTFGPTSRDA
jgi:phosphopantetheinyl transferase